MRLLVRCSASGFRRETQPVGSRVAALAGLQRLRRVELQMDVKHRMIVFDAADIDAESAFWAGLLGGTVVEDGPRWRNIWVDGEWQLGVQLAPDHVQPEWPDGTPHQAHFDFYVVGIEGLDAAHTEITGLGGRLLNLPAIARPREESRRTPT